MRLQLPEQVWLDLSPASFGSRALAFILDQAIKFIIIGLMLIVFFSSTPFAKILDYSDKVQAVAIILYFIFDWTYALLFEVHFNGVSPGKYLVGLRVVDQRGLPITVKRSFLRNLLNPIDIMAGGVTALLSMMLTKRSQRLGDIVAGTMVVHEPEEISTKNMLVKDQELLRVPPELYQAIQQFQTREKTLSTRARENILTGIYKALGDIYHSQGKTVSAPSPSNHKAALRWLGEQLSNMTPVQKDAQEVSWTEVNNQLLLINSALDATSKPRLEPTEIRRLANSYQSLCHLYAYLQSFYPKTQQSKVASTLLRKGRRLIYGRRLDKLSRGNSGFLDKSREQFKTIKYHVGLAAVLFFGPMIISALFLQINPELGWHLIGEDTDEALRQGSLWTERIRGKSASAAAGIMTNNINVTFIAFAGGIAAGIMTAVTMVYNGILIGSMFSLLGKYDMDSRLLDFVLAHGFLELSIIVVAGGAGFYLGDAILNPGELSRIKAVGKHASNLVDLIFFNAICLVVAGLVEGYISPYDVGFAEKLTVGVLLGLIYWTFLFSSSSRSNPDK